jgi:hypothetical protein
MNINDELCDIEDVIILLRRNAGYDGGASNTIILETLHRITAVLIELNSKISLTNRIGGF